MDGPAWSRWGWLAGVFEKGEGRGRGSWEDGWKGKGEDMGGGRRGKGEDERRGKPRGEEHHRMGKTGEEEDGKGGKGWGCEEGQLRGQG